MNKLLSFVALVATAAAMPLSAETAKEALPRAQVASDAGSAATEDRDAVTTAPLDRFGTTPEGEASLAPQQKAYLDRLRALAWIDGPTTVEVAGNSKLVIPRGFVYLDVKGTDQYLEMNENLASGREVMVAPASLDWSAYLAFEDEGYVKDDDKIDAQALLQTLKDGTEQGNAERARRGWPAMHVLDWAVKPEYNATTKRLEWATLLESGGSRSANFSTKILGRRGHTSVILAASPEALPEAEAALNRILEGYSFERGETYAEWQPGDKVAEYGLAALVVGGAAAIATKKGFWGLIAGFLAAGWKFALAAAVAASAWLRKLFSPEGMNASFEVLLPVGAIAFYLYDAVQLLHANELLLLRSGGRWQVRGASDLRVFGRRVAMPGLLAPQALLFKVRWSESDPRALLEDASRIDAFAQALRGPGVIVVLLLALLLLALPIASIGFGAGAALLGVFAAYYLLVLVALGLAYRRRAALGIAGRPFWSLALDVLACAPFAVNLVRKLSLRRGLQGDPLAFARAHFPAEALAALRELVGAAVAPDLEAAAAGSPQRAAIEAMLANLGPAR